VTTLLDSNVLIALTFPEHEHSERARTWFANQPDSFATCPVTQGSLVRFLLRQGVDAMAAKAVLAAVTGLPRHVFWPDSIAYTEVRMEGVSVMPR
jgi:predicted nucleic acid-binding protein